MLTCVKSSMGIDKSPFRTSISADFVVLRNVLAIRVRLAGRGTELTGSVDPSSGMSMVNMVNKLSKCECYNIMSLTGSFLFRFIEHGT